MDYANMTLLLLSGLGAFMIGFKILSDSIKELSGGGLQQLFKKTNNSPLAGVGIGIATTAIVQSSSVTTVMVIGFVNAGVMTLYQATAIIMGANIGTTITAQIVALQSLDFIKYAMALSVIGIFINLFSKKDKTKIIGYALAGLGLLFMGLNLMSSAMAGFKDSQIIINLLSRATNPFLLLFIGLFVTAIVQSSSATSAIVISMVAAGMVIGNGGNAVLFVILGTNIGTTVTALLSSIGASTNAKRASLIHILFNVLGSFIFFVFLVLYKGFNEQVLAAIFPLKATQIAMFHTLFNITSAALFLPFSKGFVMIVTKILPDKIAQGRISNLDDRLLLTPVVALAQLDKEIFELAKSSMTSLEWAVEGFINKDTQQKAKVMENSDKISRNTDEIKNYMLKLSLRETNYKIEVQMSALHNILTDIWRISEISENITRYTDTSIEKGLIFSDAVMVELKAVLSDLKQLFVLTMQVFKDKKADKLYEVDKIEDNIDAAKRRLIEEHITRLNSGECHAASSSVYISLVSNLERVGDHIYLIAHAG